MVTSNAKVGVFSKVVLKLISRFFYGDQYHAWPTINQNTVNLSTAYSIKKRGRIRKKEKWEKKYRNKINAEYTEIFTIELPDPKSDNVLVYFSEDIPEKTRVVIISIIKERAFKPRTIQREVE